MSIGPELPMPRRAAHPIGDSTNSSATLTMAYLLWLYLLWPTYYGAACYGATYYGAAYYGATFYGAAYYGATYYGSAYYGAAYYGAAYYGSAYRRRGSTNTSVPLMHALFGAHPRLPRSFGLQCCPFLVGSGKGGDGAMDIGGAVSEGHSTLPLSHDSRSAAARLIWSSHLSSHLPLSGPRPLRGRGWAGLLLRGGGGPGVWILGRRPHGGK